jgi:26S proteasome regulatory subunit N1
MSPKSDATEASKAPEVEKEKKAPADTKAKEEELSEEDRLLKEELDLCVTRLKENDASLYPAALESLRKLIRASTTSMTSVPKPLKFMREHYADMKTVYEKIDGNKTPQVKSDCADIVSVLSMTMGENNECLKFKLLGDTSLENLEAWGHEYVRHLAGEIVTEWHSLEEETTEGADQVDLKLVKLLRISFVFLNAQLGIRKSSKSSEELETKSREEVQF